MANIEFSFSDRTGRINEQEITRYIEKNAALLDLARGGQSCYADSLGWLDPETWCGEEALRRIASLAEEVRRNADVFVLIGVGGSNQAARAVISAIQTQGPRIIYAGNSLSAHSMKQVLSELEGKSVYINVIAKNFETLEPGLGFRVLRRYLHERYGEQARERIIATGSVGSHLQALAERHGYQFLTFPEDIGGRYSVFSDVGLFPMAVAGIDIRGLVEGAKQMRAQIYADPAQCNIAFRYAAARNLLHQKGMAIEMLSVFEPRFRYFIKWWVQLFAESEGKQSKGIYPVAGEYSEDLHSVGQFVQEGSPLLFETFLDARGLSDSLLLEPDAVDDRFDYLNGKDLREVNLIAQEATFRAHSERLPCLRFTLREIDANSFGALFYLFSFSCYLSGMLLGINPFDQPGVEAYKKLMFESLGK